MPLCVHVRPYVVKNYISNNTRQFPYLCCYLRPGTGYTVSHYTRQELVSCFEYVFTRGTLTMADGAPRTVFFLSPVVSHTRTV